MKVRNVCSRVFFDDFHHTRWAFKWSGGCLDVMKFFSGLLVAKIKVLLFGGFVSEPHS